MSREKLEQTSRAAQLTVKDLAQAAQEEPTRQAFGEPLRQALSGDPRAALDRALAQLLQDASADQGLDQQLEKQRARSAQEALAQLAQAFAGSLPKALQNAQARDALKEQPPESFEGRDRLARKQVEEQLTQIDPTRWPPAYRARIQKYFEKLSEK